MAIFVPNTEDITIYRGDDVKLAFLFTDDDVPRDFTDWDDFELIVRRETDKAPLITSVDVSSNNSAITGQVIASFDESDFAQTHLSTTGLYQLKGVYTNPENPVDIRAQTLAVGSFNITDDVG